MRRLPHLLLATTLSLSGVALLAQAPTPAAAATGWRTTLIGDQSLSSLADGSGAVRDMLSAVSPGWAMDAEDCRQTALGTCSISRGTPTSVLDMVRSNRGALGEVAVVMAGYNDTIDSPSDPTPLVTAFRRDLRKVMTELSSQTEVKTVLWLTLRSNDTRVSVQQRAKYDQITAVLTEADTGVGVDDVGNPYSGALYAKLRLADWKTASTTVNCGTGNNQDCFQANGITPRANTGGTPSITTSGVQRLVEFLITNLNAIPGTPSNPAQPNGIRCNPSTIQGDTRYAADPADPPPAPLTPEDARFTGITPVRVLDTRAGQGDPINLPVGAGRFVRAQVIDNVNVPPSATAVALNVTAVGPCTQGFITVFPCGPYAEPNASNLNFRPNQTIPNAVTVRVGTLGRVCVYSDSQTDLLVDVAGFFSPGTTGKNGHAGLTPTRLVDTRPGTLAVSPDKTKIPAGGTKEINLNALGVASGTAAVGLNVTAVAPSGAGFLTVFPAPCGDLSRPQASNVNYSPGEVAPNFVTVNVPTGGNAGRVCVYSFATTDVIVDLNSTFSVPETRTFKPLVPARVVDTRPGTAAQLSGPPFKSRLQPNVPLTVPVRSAMSLPGGTDAVTLNITAVLPSSGGFFTVYPCGAIPVVSNMNFITNDVRANLVDVKLDGSGNVCVVSNAASDLIMDLTGYYS